MRKANNPHKLLSRTALAGFSFILVGLSGQARADWIESAYDSRCDPAIVAQMSDAKRDTIEASVRRAEASILPPSAVGDLSCLNDLMTAPLDTFSSIGGLVGSLSGGIQDVSLSGLNLDIDVAGAICDVAAEKWATLTEPLNGLGTSLTSFASTAASSADRIASGSVPSIPGFTGTTQTTDSSGYSGSIDDYTVPDTSLSTVASARPIDLDENIEEVDQAALQASYDDYWAQSMGELAGYIGCRVAANLDGTRQNGTYGGTWDTRPNAADCTFSPGSAPSFDWSGYSTSSSALTTYTESDSSSSRVFGQERPEAATTSVDTTGGATSGGVWGALGE